MSLAIIQPAAEDVSTDEYREAMVMWLLFIYNEGYLDKARKRSQLSDDIILSTCLVNPGHWTLRLALGIINDESHKKARHKYQEQIFEAMKAKEVPYARTCEIAFKAIALMKFDEVVEAGSEKPWVPKPIGTI